MPETIMSQDLLLRFIADIRDYGIEMAEIFALNSAGMKVNATHRFALRANALNLISAIENGYGEAQIKDWSFQSGTKTDDANSTNSDKTIQELQENELDHVH